MSPTELLGVSSDFPRGHGVFLLAIVASVRLPPDHGTRRGYLTAHPPRVGAGLLALVPTVAYFVVTGVGSSTVHDGKQLADGRAGRGRPVHRRRRDVVRVASLRLGTARPGGDGGPRRRDGSLRRAFDAHTWAQSIGGFLIAAAIALSFYRRQTGGHCDRIPTRRLCWSERQALRPPRTCAESRNVSVRVGRNPPAERARHRAAIGRSSRRREVCIQLYI